MLYTENFNLVVSRLYVAARSVAPSTEAGERHSKTYLYKG